MRTLKYKKTGICGHFGGGKNFYDGQTIKTKILTKEITKVIGNENIKIVDTYGGKKVLFKCLSGLFKMLNECDNIIILPANNSLRIFGPYLGILNSFFNKKLHYVVIGGWLPEFLKKRKFLAYCLKKFDYIYVETLSMKKALESIGFKNVIVMPNFKDLKVLSYDELVYCEKKTYKLCTFSRVMKEKGIEDAIRAVKNINKKMGKVVFELDIYGQIDVNYKKRFEIMQKKFPSFIKYKGIVEFDKSTEVLKEYFALLFPTYYEGEGFAGTLLDALAAGVPVVASDWKYNNEIIVDGKTGIIIKDCLQLELMKILNNIDEWNSMKLYCLKESKKYLPNEVVKKIIKHI